MTKPSSTPSSSTAVATLAADFAHAKQYWQSARVAAGQSAAFMVLMGAELERLFKSHGKTHGGARKGSSLQPESLKWEDIVKAHVGCSEAQAWRAREMFKASRKRVDLLNGQELLSTSIAEMPVAKQEAMLKAVSKVTDGKSAAELMREFGISKKEQGGAAKGGDTRKPKAAAPAADADESKDETPATPATEADSKIPKDVDPRAWKLNQLLEEALQDGWWNDCPEAFRKTLHGNLVDAGTRVAKTLKKDS